MAPEPDERQFHRADPTSPTHVGAAVCAMCHQRIADDYYEARGQIVCRMCRNRVEAEQSKGSGLERAVRAMVFGTVAAVGGAVLYFTIVKVTGYELGLVAIAVGYLVGVAVKKGAYGRGGWGYQWLAMALTYCSIVSMYVPSVYTGFQEGIRQAHAARTPAGATAEHTAVDSTGVKPVTGQRPSADVLVPTSKPVRIPPLGWVLIIAIAFAAPFLMGFRNLIGWVIIGVGLYQAWKINRPARVTFAGPFTLGTPRSGSTG